MNKWLARWAQTIWYTDSLMGRLLSPLSLLFMLAVGLRRFLYQSGMLTSHRLPVPVIVVGNISVGGTGKTPLIIWLAQFLKQAGYRPGIISRGYHGQAKTWPQWVDSQARVIDVGDEALLLATHSACPMAVGPVRAAAAHFLIKKSACDVILSDDGLQHYALGRDIEIAVIDGERRFGNGYCLPAGPLREPVSRLNDADLVIVNGNRWYNGQFSFQLAGDSAINLRSSEHRPLSAFKGSGCHALAGIGNPQRFFNLLTSAGLTIIAHEFPDHFAFQHCDISFDDDLPVLMTEKDAVKCKAFASEQHWYVPVQARPNPDFAKQLINLLRDHHDR